jgi:diphosphomevalonate decarboxylase
LQAARLAGAAERLAACRDAILQRDFNALARVTELDNHLMHAVMMTSQPPLLYWQAASVSVMHAVTDWRGRGTPCCYTLDAGPNVHVICAATAAESVSAALAQIPGVLRVLRSAPGGAARLVD